MLTCSAPSRELVPGTAIMPVERHRIADAAANLDALTTVMSLIAQYMLTRKLIENWYVWLTADAIYIGLYVYKHLYLTAGLYGIFMAMCCAGLAQWRSSLAPASAPAPIPLAGAVSA